MLKTKKRYDCAAGCPVEATLDLIDGKWKGVIIYHLLSGTLRFNEIRRKLPSATQRMLTRQLRELEESGLVLRTVYAQVPPRVDYALTEEGRSLEEIVRAMHAWGEHRLERLRQVQAAA
ncbi:helix-turn-helix domain-containing protein [Bosea sp. (in: a-proteobacteria)]|mgnify:FL=1|jgi:DNA-binding HxlR family transcriptional regulator|uniref:Winged helix-turn-helix transcriptional regulator n=1 Tax=Bosea vestrisii TaxID=151416 RepID=A0ABW0HGS1_9HYPH|nr:helix-turn-helix domain-containing protein [Bosea sp. (in: a-proteobacteria)]MBA4224290.1 transcriptional regulator [Methylobacterium sp.]MBR3193840.1 helix-turn-helix transcriptional regulator [Bosea sp. (in: a-proteobacteria)]